MVQVLSRVESEPMRRTRDIVTPWPMRFPGLDIRAAETRLVSPRADLIEGLRVCLKRGRK